MKMKNALLGVALFVGALGAANAQQSATQPCGAPATEFVWGNDKPTAQEKNALYNDEMKLGNNRKAVNALSWLLKNTPTLNPAIYINGVTLYDALAEAEADAAKKRVYQDSVMVLYDLRIKHYCSEAENVERKAYYAYKYWVQDPQRQKELYNVLKRSVELNKENVSSTSAVGYMLAIHNQKKANPKVLTDEQVLAEYEVVISALDKALQADPSQAEAIGQLKEYVDGLLVATINVDCDFLEKNFGPKLKQNPSDVKLAKQVFQLLRAGKCTESPMYMSTIKAIYAVEPTFELAKYLALKALNDGNTSDANKYLNDAIRMAKTNADKGELYLLQAQLASKRGANSEARSLAYKAIEADPGSASKAYSLIGRLYEGATECYKKESRVQDRLIFLAAYEMYQKAGDSAGMNRAKAQFPSKGELFDENIAVGAQMPVGCWIGENVTIRTRD